MIEVKLGNGLFTKIDDEDADLQGFNWSAHKDNKTDPPTYYACTRFSVGGIRQRTWLHHEVIERKLERSLKPDEIPDHINRDKLDNRRENLRVATRSENEVNKKKSRGFSKYKGVSYNRDRKGKPWRAVITQDRKNQHLGYFEKESQAARAYNEAATSIYGEFAVLNEVE